MSKLILCFLLSAIALFADVTGKWSGTGKHPTSDGGAEVMTVSLELKQSGDDVTGVATTGQSEDRYSAKGTLAGDVLTLQVDTGDDTYTVTVTVKEDTMTGEATTEHDGAKVKVKLDLKRGS
ncbi:MAG: hypothetical protein ABSH09_17040 [Bryobacteraceae bacterium]|jgi:hypothetical protein